MEYSKTASLKMSLGALLACLAIMVRVIVPAGFMIATPSDASTLAGPNMLGIPITLCTSQGSISAFINSEGDIVDGPNPAHQSPHEKGSGDTGDCAFGSTATPLRYVTELVRDVAPSKDLVLVLAAIWRDKVPGRGLAAPPPPKTGPPIQI